MASLAAVRFAMGLTCTDHFQHAKGRDRLREAPGPLFPLFGQRSSGERRRSRASATARALPRAQSEVPPGHEIQDSVQAIVQGL